MHDPLSISVIVPVLREADAISGLLCHLRSLDAGGRFQIILSDGDPEGGTIRAVADREIVAVAGHPGRGGQLNRGAVRATGDILLFLHADTHLPDGAFDRIRSCLADPGLSGGCFDLGIDSPRRVFRITERYVALRTRLTRVPFGDQAIFLRREYFRLIGGYREIPLMEDVELMSRIRRRGDRICIIPAKVSTSARRWEKEGVVLATLRNWMLQALFCLGVAPERLARFYR